MNSNNFGGALTFPQMPLSGQNFNMSICLVYDLFSEGKKTQLTLCKRKQRNLHNIFSWKLRNIYIKYIEANVDYLVTFCGTAVKPKPKLSDITSATATREVTPSGTFMFPLLHVSLLTETNEKSTNN